MSTSNACPFNNIPGSKGLPVVGELFDLSNGLEQFIAEKVEKHGEICQSKILNVNGVIVSGPTLVRQCGLIPTTSFAKGMSVLFGKPIAEQTPADFLKSNASIREYTSNPNVLPFIPSFSTSFQNSFKKYETEEFINVVDEMKRAVWEVVSTFIMGHEFSDESKEKVFNCFTDFNRGLYAAPINFPGSKYNKGIAASKLIGEVMREELEKRKKNPLAYEGNKDLMQQLIDDREGVKDEKIIARCRAVLWASLDTTTTNSVGLFQFAHDNPEVMDKVLEERKTLLEGKTFKEHPEAVFDMPYTTAAVKEALRVHNGTLMALRLAAEDTELTTSKNEKYVVPKGHRIVMAIEQTTKSSFENPERVEPERFLDPRNEDKGPQGSRFCIFGSGRRSCAGRSLAMNELRMVLSLLSQYKVVLKEKVDFKMVTFREPVGGKYFARLEKKEGL